LRPCGAQVDQFENHDRGYDQCHDKVGVGQEGLELGVDEGEAAGAKVQGEQHHQPAHLTADGLQESVVELGRCALCGAGQDAPDQPGADQEANHHQ
jgi:hypothetical protein